MKNTKRELRPRTVRMLADIAESRLTFPEVLRRRHMPRATHSGTMSWLQQKCSKSLLRSQPLYDKRVCYTVTETTVRILKTKGIRVSRSVVRPLGPDAKQLYVAAALFCNPVSGNLKSLWRPSLDRERCPELSARIASGKPDPFRRHTFYRDSEYFGYFIVDRGQQRFLDKKVRPKLLKVLDHRKYPELHKFASSGAFQLAIATAAEGRALELREELKRNPPPFPATVVVFPELSHLLPRRSGKSLYHPQKELSS